MTLTVLPVRHRAVNTEPLGRARISLCEVPAERRREGLSDTPPHPCVPTEWYFMALDSIFLCIYVVEAVLKIIALGFKYFCDPWNNLGG